VQLGDSVPSLQRSRLLDVAAFPEVAAVGVAVEGLALAGLDFCASSASSAAAAIDC
jgi:hypothetical protein